MMAEPKKAPIVWKRKYMGNFLQRSLPSRHRAKVTAGFRWPPVNGRRNSQGPGHVSQLTKNLKPKCQSVLCWFFLIKQIKINMRNWTGTFQRYHFVYLIPGHTLGYPRWPQSRKQSWQWGTFHGFHRSTPAGPQHRSQTSGGKDNEKQVYCGTPDCIRTPKIVSNVQPQRFERCTFKFNYGIFKILSWATFFLLFCVL